MTQPYAAPQAPVMDPAQMEQYYAQQAAQAAPAQQYAPPAAPVYPVPQAPAPQYAPPAPQYAPQMPQGYAPQMPQGYAPSVQGYMQQGYGQPVQQQVPLAQGSLDAFFHQPSVGGGKAWSFPQGQIGLTYFGMVARPITDADIQQQTQPNGGPPRTYSDGRPMFVMKVPLKVQPTQDNPEGAATWFVAGSVREELSRAMAEAGAPAGVPEVGAGIRVTKISERPTKFGNKAGVYRVEYWRPQGAEAQAPAQPAAQPTPAPAPAPAPATQPVPMPQPPPMAAPPVQQAPVQQPPVQQAQPAPVPAAAPAPAAPAPGNEADVQALMSKLTGELGNSAQ